MRLLYLDCTTGVSGDMLLAALIGAHEDPEAAFSDLCEKLATMEVAGYHLERITRMVGGIKTNGVLVEQDAVQPLRTMPDLEKAVQGIIGTPVLKQGIMNTIKALGTAESRVHGVPLETVHFHEIGAVDTVVDIAGTHVLVESLGVDRVMSSSINLGSGFVEFSHGRHPVPAPACAELSKGMRVMSDDSGKEKATPTGLALIKTISHSFGPLPEGEIQAVGYGSGTRSTDEDPTYVRAVITTVY